MRGLNALVVKFADDNKLEGVIDMPGGRVTGHSHCGRLGDWATKNCIRFNEDKFKVLHVR